MLQAMVHGPGLEVANLKMPVAREWQWGAGVLLFCVFPEIFDRPL